MGVLTRRWSTGALGAGCLAASLWLGTATAAAAPPPVTILRPGVDVVGAGQVLRVAPEPGEVEELRLRRDVPPPEEGEPLVVLATEEFPGVVGVVTAVNGGDEEPLVLETRRVPLARAYSEIGIHGKTLEQLADSSATDSLFSLRKFKCDRSGQAGEAAPPRIDFSLGSLTPDARIDLRSRELYFVLEGEPEISVDFSSQQAVHCEYDGPPRFHIPIHGDGGHEILPIGGRRTSPLADAKAPRWWPSDLPTPN